MTYEYTCTHCNHEWEQEQSIKDDPVKNCPKCNSETAKRLVSSKGGFILNGGGWASSGYSSSK